MIDKSITVFDFETTGLSAASGDRVIEMAAIRCEKGIVVSQFNTLVRFNGELPVKITEITGIYPAELENAMDERAAFQILSYLMKDSIIVAHNASFDMGFLHEAQTRLVFPHFGNQFVDTLTICRDRYTWRNKEEGHKLEGMCKRLGIDLTGAHRAFNDVIGCWELLKHLHKGSPVDDYINQLGYNSRYGPPEWYPTYAYLVPQELRFENRAV